MTTSVEERPRKLCQVISPDEKSSRMREMWRYCSHHSAHIEQVLASLRATIDGHQRDFANRLNALSRRHADDTRQLAGLCASLLKVKHPDCEKLLSAQRKMYEEILRDRENDYKGLLQEHEKLKVRCGRKRDYYFQRRKHWRVALGVVRRFVDNTLQSSSVV